jgi:hypothetical protein
VVKKTGEIRFSPGTRAGRNVEYKIGLAKQVPPKNSMGLIEL